MTDLINEWSRVAFVCLVRTGATARIPLALHGMDCEDVPDDSNDIINNNLVLMCVINVTLRHRQTEQECSR